MLTFPQSRLSRIFLSTIPLEAMTKVQLHVCYEIALCLTLLWQAQAEHLRSLFFPESQEDY